MTSAFCHTQFYFTSIVTTVQKNARRLFKVVANYLIPEKRQKNRVDEF